jgi:hypothetical protein
MPVLQLAWDCSSACAAGMRTWGQRRACSCACGQRRGRAAQMSVTLMVATLMQRSRFRPLPPRGVPAFPLQAHWP